ncbi:MAG: hypothetical protein GC168_17925 [Candidatus Hydrogenedens sp.]|nr:hypothetical protein [Candidatus Hydrogenedens sp.]
MARKDSVSLQRGGDFDEMDELLNEALAGLEASNERVINILEGAKDIVPGSELDDEDAERTADAADTEGKAGPNENAAAQSASGDEGR